MAELRKGQKIQAVRCEVYSRVVGYYRPVSAWNEGKREEYRQRHQQSLEDVRRIAGEERSR
jgi:anaerobic ribonucleoside-triphosphate reductase